MKPSTYRLHGLRIRSEIPLGEPPCQDPDPLDIRISLDVREGGATVADGTTVAQFAPGGTPLYQVIRMGSGAHLLRVNGVSDFEVSADLSEVRCRPWPGVDVEWVQILLRGTLLALLLDLGGRSTLHASAVEIDGGAVALAGGSGAGKTTTAALLCAAGARLVSEDVLAVDLEPGGPRCRPGSTELRLRPAASGLAQPSWVRARRPLVDGRLAVRAETTPLQQVPLRAVVFPRPDRSATVAELTRVRPAEAALWLAAVPRICWSDWPEATRRAFLHSSRLATEVPVFAARIPWGPPWPAAGSLRLADLLAEAAA